MVVRTVSDFTDRTNDRLRAGGFMVVRTVTGVSDRTNDRPRAGGQSFAQAPTSVTVQETIPGVWSFVQSMISLTV